MNSVYAEQTVAAILRMTLKIPLPSGDFGLERSVGYGPQTTQGKWLALCLIHSLGSGCAQLRDRPALYKQLGISARQGPKGYQDLVACGWIIQDLFSPVVTAQSERLIHWCAISRLLEYPEDAANDLELHHDIGLKPDNRLLLMTLLTMASKEGRIDSVSDARLTSMTGFTSTQLKGQMQRLKRLGFVSGVIPGVTCPDEFGRGKSYVYLNLLHPWWAIFYSEWRVIHLSPFIWEAVQAVERKAFRKIMRKASPEDLSETPSWSVYSRQVRMYLRHLVFVEASERIRALLANERINGSDAEPRSKWISSDLSYLVGSILNSLVNDHKYPIG